MPSRPAPRAFALVLALAAAGCSAQADLGDMRREQRLLARRLADTRADLESLRIAMSRLQGRVDDLAGPRGGRGLAVPPDPGQAAGTWPAPAPAPAPAEVVPPSIDATVPPEPPGTIQGGRVWPPDTPVEAAPPNSPPPASPAAPGEAGPASPPTPLPEGTTVDVSRDAARGGPVGYREGLAAYQAGDYPRAIQALRTFANGDAKNELVPSARYWIGEAYFAQRRYNEAILAYNDILVGWPNSDRVPAALLRQAAAFAELGDLIDARLTLKKLVDTHPGTAEAAIAKRRLLSLGS